MTRRDNAEREDHYHYGLMLAISSNSSDPATAHLALLWTHAVDNEAAAHIVKEAEELVRLLDADHICTCATEDGFRLYASVTGRRGASWSGKLQIAWPAAGGGGGVNDMQRTPSRVWGEGERASPMKPAGYVLSVRALPSTLTRRCMRMYFTSLVFRAYLRRLRSKMMSGRHSRSLCGPVDGLGAQMPPSLSSIQCLGAFSRFKCLLGPRAMAADTNGHTSDTGEAMGKGWGPGGRNVCEAAGTCVPGRGAPLAREVT